MLKNILIIGAGGFIGSVLRYLTQVASGKLFSLSFPAGTFIVNILGCFIIGVVYALFEKGNLLNAEMRLFLAVGFCGGFTTFSTFSNDNLILLKDSQLAFLFFNIFGSVILGVAAVYLGIIAVKTFL
ncbi:MAG TPA: fluoride efflux transporter CrcB [Prolixibacteraceae bacterium]|nr:fluoride efflux transporter CrcB [Prolixibacteraceae bacterium]HQN92777.1 fluoride efflux transporter CrcB [Prolixibacteraceae bacterium]HUM88126.1 fluoride efflux transporter CrcB [Prolixibacteraceae bacterium]